jgi:transcriptional regulator of acetoin/glycerol metabolism
MSENKNAKTPADGDPLPVATSAMTLEETRQWIADTWKRCQDEAWRQPTTPSVVVYLTAGSYSLEMLENLVELLRKVADD